MDSADSGKTEVPASTVDSLHEMLIEEIRKLRTADDWKRWLKTATAFHEHSFRNAILIAAQRPDATLVGGWSTWKHLGRNVSKGEKAIRVFAPVFSRSKQVVDDKGAIARRVDLDLADDSETAKRRPGRRLVGFRVAYVWDVSQTNGEPLPKPPASARLVGPAPTGLWEGLATCVEGEGFRLSVEPIKGSVGDGFTDFEARRIVVSDSLSEAAAVSTLAHEVAHMRMHDPDAVAASGSVMCRGMREVEAESVAFILLAHHGLETDGDSFPYVAGWAASVDKAHPERVVQRSGERVLRMTRELIDLTSSYGVLAGRKPPVRHLSLVPGADAPAPDGPGI
ncbi:hypothetical protein GCM10028799_39020 [Kribbella italica]